MKNTKETYLAPAVEVVELQVECGFALSNPQPETLQTIGEEKADLPW